MDVMPEANVRFLPEREREVKMQIFAKRNVPIISKSFKTGSIKQAKHSWRRAKLAYLS